MQPNVASRLTEAQSQNVGMRGAAEGSCRLRPCAVLQAPEMHLDAMADFLTTADSALA
jgi:hypothetical protein